MKKLNFVLYVAVALIIIGGVVKNIELVSKQKVKHISVFGQVTHLSSEEVDLSDMVIRPVNNIGQFQQQLNRSMTEKRIMRIDLVFKDKNPFIINKVEFIKLK